MALSVFRTLYARLAIGLFLLLLVVLTVVIVETTVKELCVHSCTFFFE